MKGTSVGEPALLRLIPGSRFSLCAAVLLFHPLTSPIGGTVNCHPITGRQTAPWLTNLTKVTAWVPFVEVLPPSCELKELLETALTFLKREILLCLHVFLKLRNAA